MRLSGAARLAAASVATAAWIGLVLEAIVVLRRVGSAELALLVLLRYFTVTTNLLVAAVFTGLALARDVHSRIIAGTALAIGLVGLVYHLMLAGFLRPVGDAATASFLMHTVTPLAVPLYWAGFARKGALRWRDPVGWSIYPLAYLAYALGRAGIEGRPVYPFLDVARYGAGGVARTCLVIAVLFTAAGLLLVGADRLLARLTAPAGQEPPDGSTSAPRDSL